eukprot:GEMP01055858.1.p1 GENE.GEMP01055858.1~~GEMP01055858.1.p1  ORF type:complete len:245 (+),score=44.48 GEMP01055858.1:233-967(+)
MARYTDVVVVPDDLQRPPPDDEEHQRHSTRAQDDSSHGFVRFVTADDTSGVLLSEDGEYRVSDEFSLDKSVADFRKEKGWVGPLPCIVRNVTCTATIKVRLDDESRRQIWASFRHLIPFGWDMNASECVFQIAFPSEQKKIANERLKADKKHELMVQIKCETLCRGRTCWALGVTLPAYAPRTHERPATILVAQADICSKKELFDTRANWTFLPETEKIPINGQVMSYDILQRFITGRHAGPRA